MLLELVIKLALKNELALPAPLCAFPLNESWYSISNKNWRGYTQPVV
jgi:hypothetical protein